MADGAPPPEEDFNAIPIPDRLAHKNWKARVSAYEALVKIFSTTASDSDPTFKPYNNNPDTLKKIATDANAVAQEKGLECLVAFVKYAGENAARTREVVVPALVDKCFGSARAGTKNQAVELSLQYVEVENGAAGVVENILPGLAAKQPKTVAGCVTALKEIVRQFGTTVVPPPPILKALPKIFGHSDKTVRAEGTQLVRVMYQYIGPAIETFLNDLKPVQVKELKEAFEEMEKEGKGRGSLKPERMTRQGAREAEAAAEAGGDGDADAPPEEEAPPDPRMFAEEVDIVPKMPANFQASLKSSKWKDRKEALDGLLAVVNATPRIKEASELGELARSLATCVQKDANINCVMVAANCLEGLAKGLMGPFAKYRESVVPPMLERLKERKANVTDAIGNALDAVFATTTLTDILPDTLPALNSKNPQVKEGTLKFIARSLSNSPTPLPAPQIKPLSEALATLLEDSFEGARNEAAVCLGTLMKMVGERPLNALMDGLADVRKAKVKEAYDNAKVKAKAGSGAPAKPAAPPPKEPPKKKVPPPKQAPTTDLPAVPSEDNLAPPAENKPVKKPPARLMAKKPPTSGAAEGGAGAPAAAVPAPKKLPPAAAAKPAKGGAAPASGALDTFKFKHTPEDAEALAAEVIPAKYATELGDSNWKVRLAALEEMTTWVEGAVEGLDSEVVIRFLAKKGWNEKNFQVSTKLYGILGTLADRCPSFGRASAALCIPHLSEKLGDMKLKKPAGDTLLLFAEKTSLQFVLGHAYEPLSKQKAPKVLADALTWVEQALVEFGIAGLSLRSLIEFLKTALKNSNAAVRTNATKTLVTVRLFAGSSIKDLLEDLNPQLLATIFTEFDKVEGTPAPEPARMQEDLAGMAPAGGAGSKAAASGGDPLDDLFPRVEIDGLLKGTTILADAKSDAWKTKKEALETLQAILDQGANKRLKPTMGEIAQVLKARVVDANKPVQMLALDIVARIATGMGKPFEKHTRFFVVPVASVLSDQKAPCRAAALQTLTAIVNACEGFEPIVANVGTALETNNPLQRASMLGWLVDWFKEHELPPGLDLSSWAGPVVSCLDDRNADVRKSAQALLPTLIASAGYDYVLNQTNSLKPASKSTALPIIQAARGSSPAAAKGAPAPAAVKAAPAKAVPAAPPKAASPPPTELPSAESSKVAPPSKLGGVRRKLPQGSIARPESRAETPTEPAVTSRLPGPGKLGGLKRPGAPLSGPSKPAPVDAPDTSSLIFTSSNPETKRLRLAKDVNKWVIESGPSRKDLAELLQHQMEPHASKELLALLFSHDHNAVNDHVNGLGLIQDFYSSAQTGDDKLQSICIANSDLALKFVSIKVHEPQSNLVQKCVEVVDSVLTFFQSVDYQLSDQEALVFIPTIVHKLGDAREPVRIRVSQVVQKLPKVYAYSRVFQLLLEHGLQSKVAKTRQGTLDELAGVLKRFGIGACEPSKAFPKIASMISDKDPAVRKSALATLSEGYVLVGEKIWGFVGMLSPKDKTQLEERLRRVPGSSTPDKVDTASLATHASRIGTGISRSGSPAPSAMSRIGGVARPASPALAAPSRLARPASPSNMVRSSSPAPSQISKLPGPSHLAGPGSPSSRPKSLLPSRLGPPRSRLNGIPGPSSHSALPAPSVQSRSSLDDGFSSNAHRGGILSRRSIEENHDQLENTSEDITVTISSILSNDPTRSVEALKKIQKVLEVGPDNGPSSSAYQELAEHTEGLIETITLQMAHVFERPEDITLPENFRLAKHLIQTLNAFCDHVFLAESLTVDILTSLLEELTLRLLQTDNSPDGKVKDLSRFINMIILRLFATGRRMSIFRALFALLLRIVKPFPASGTSSDSQEAKVAELVLKCVWKLARNIPQDLEKHILDPVELFPAVEHFLQSVPPNEWRARATNKVPCGDMPLRTIKVIIQHVVAQYGDDVYDHLSSAFDDPSATIVYPYVYRILNSSTKTAAEVPLRPEPIREEPTRPSTAASRPLSPQETASTHSVTSDPRAPSSSSHSRSRSVGSTAETVQEPDLDEQLNTIIDHISSETTGAMHKEGITELHHYLKAYPHKKPKVDKILESTGSAFRKYITRALASRAAEDEERNVAVTQTLSRLEFNGNGIGRERTESISSLRDLNGHGTVPTSPVSAAGSRAEVPSPRSPPRSSISEMPDVQQEKLSRLHDIFQYNRQSTISNGSSQGRSTPSVIASVRSGTH
ncbi:ARM repeat-containing protein [Dichomitus squalens LYAD-421 SS1]|uniref:ARM repeat-containing protein n=1 Tax=Dichomitus squalens (strain LYAD-421) TaxID=732165 RepID=UPI0004414D1F|nr:ARM repeat-containing protein [Dichomitus squalens LYAD-421 SS1]EJF65775.1 ARM repeat-containing protein [Dichomitus squalens LYAD-421 SS1]